MIRNHEVASSSLASSSITFTVINRMICGGFYIFLNISILLIKKCFSAKFVI